MSGVASSDATTGTSSRRVLALALFWFVQFVLITVVGLVSASVAMGIESGIDEISSRLFDVGGYLSALFFQPEGRVILLAYALVATATTLLVTPLIGPLRLSVTGRSLHSSVVGASIIGGLIAFALVGLIVELPLLYGGGKNLGFLTTHPVGLFSSWAISSAIWTAILWKAGASRDPMGLDRFVRRLFALTMLEMVLAVPIFLMARKKESCYCSLHSFFGMLGGTVVLFMLCGPWAVLFLTRKARRGWHRSGCPRCGYPRRTDAAVCSECGETLPPRVETDLRQGQVADS